MNDDAEAARRYRQRAKEIRAILQSTDDRVMRKALEGIAADYERLAHARIRIGRLAKSRLWRPSARLKKK
jgi:hypothetical protein